MKKLFVSLIAISTLSVSSFSSFANDVSISEEGVSKIFNRAGISAKDSSAYVVSIKDGTTIFQHNINKPLMPASNLKLITSAASLALLKPEFRFKTVIYADSYASSGVLNGNIYLKGYGDPDLTGERLWRMVKKLKNTGVTQITGDLIADESFFDDKEVSEGWNVRRYGDSVYSARVSALSVNRNIVDVWLRGGNNQGEKAVVTLEPENDFFYIENQTVTGGGYPNVVISRVPTKDGKNKIIVKGNVPKGSHSEVNKINLDNPGLYTGYVLKKLLEKEGITIKGTVKKGITPKTSPELVSSNSRTLAAIVYDFNKNSVNIIGEILLKHLGASFKGAPGTSKKGAEVIKKEFFEKMIKTDSSQLNMADGSGLSPLNRVTAEHFVKVLRYMYTNFSLQSDYMASLPVAGADGTLRKRSRKTIGERKYRGKTGFINGVSCLSGYTVSKDGEPIAFSILVNNFRSMDAALSVQDGISTYLATSNFNR